MTIAPLLQLSTSMFNRWLERRKIKSELASLDVFDNHFERKIQAGLAGQKWATNRRINLNIRLKDLENGR